MNSLQFLFSRLPIRWKLTFWSALLLCVLFVAYNAAQYLVITQWLMNQEERRIRGNLTDIKNYFQNKPSSLSKDEINAGTIFLANLNQKNQFIRILNPQSEPIISVTKELSFDWVTPQHVKSNQVIGVWHNQDHLLIYRSPLGQKPYKGTIEIVDNLETFDRLNDMVLLVVLAGGIGAVILSGLGGWIISRQLLKPIQSVTDTMKRIKQNGLNERVVANRNKDEISDLTVMFNQMMDQLEGSFNQQKQFVEDASHELRTPISIMEGHLSLLQRWGKSDPAILEESLQASLQELSRLKGLVYDLLELSQAESQFNRLPIPDIDPTIIIREAVEEFAFLHPSFRFDVDFDLISHSAFRVAVMPNHLSQIILILLENSVKYSTDHKKIIIRGLSQQQHLIIEIEDFGEGVPIEEISLVFNRFYRVDKARSRAQGGNGLGLAIAKRLVENYHGTIVLRSDGMKGTCVTLQFPMK